MIRLMLMCYVDFIAFMENPEKLGMISLQRRCKKHRQNQVFSIRGLTFEKYTPKS